MEENKNIIAVCQYLIEIGRARSFSQIAKKCGKTAQYFTDLKSGKAQYSLNFLDRLSENYPVNKSFVLTGEGEMLRNIENISESNSNQEKDYLAIIKNQSDQISELIKQVAANGDRLDDLHRIIEFQRRELEELKAQKNASPAGDGKVAAAG